MARYHPADIFCVRLLQKSRARTAAQFHSRAARQRYEAVVRNVWPPNAQRAARRAQRVCSHDEMRSIR